VILTASAQGQTFSTATTMNLAATASDPGGAITKVEFYAGATLVGTDPSAPYTAAWSGMAAGNYTFTATATDNAGAVTTPGAVTACNNDQSLARKNARSSVYVSSGTCSAG
jgi:chitinase